MDKRHVIIGALLALGTASSCACETVEAGNVGIKVSLLGSEKGDLQQVGIGRHFVGINERLYKFPVYEQNYIWTKTSVEGSPNDESFTFQTKEGLSVNADIGISYSIDGSKVVDVFKKYRRGVDEITDVFLRNHVRDSLNSAASKMGVEDVYGAGKIRLLDDVQKDVSGEVAPLGINISKIYLIGEFRLPPTVVTALNAKIEATQRAQQRENELREAEAAARKRVAEAEGEAGATLAVAKAQAEANYILSKSLTRELVEYERVKKWDGKLPQFTGGATPLIEMGGK